MWVWHVRYVPVYRYLKNGKDKSLQDCEEKVQQLSEAVRSKNTEKKDLEGKMATLNKELANAKVCFHSMLCSILYSLVLFHSSPLDRIKSVRWRITSS